MLESEGSLGSAATSDTSIQTLRTTNRRTNNNNNNNNNNDPVLLIAILELDGFDHPLAGGNNHTNDHGGDSGNNNNNSNDFVTKLRIRASEVTTTTGTIRGNSNRNSSRHRRRRRGNNSSRSEPWWQQQDSSDSSSTASSSSSSSYCRDLIYTAKELRTKIQQHFFAASSCGMLSHQSSSLASSSSFEFDVHIYDAVTKDYILLPGGGGDDNGDNGDGDDDCNIVERFGSRWRIRLTENTRAQQSLLLAQKEKPLLAIQGRFYEFDGTLNLSNLCQLQFDESPCQQQQQQQQQQQHSGGTGFSIWDGSLLLARYLSEQQAPAAAAAAAAAASLVRGQRVLELGAGCGGVAGIAAAALGAQHVTLTDLPEIVPFLQSNVNRNMQTVRRAAAAAIAATANADMASSVGDNDDKDDDDDDDDDSLIMSCRTCDWYNPPRDLFARRADGGAPFDVILVADCIWMEHLVAPLLAVLKRLTDDNGDDATTTGGKDDGDDEGIMDALLQEKTKPVQWMDDMTMLDQLANHSISHMDLKSVEKDESPVSSWANIYNSHYRSSGSCSMRDMDEEISYGSLHEPPPPDNNFRAAAAAAAAAGTSDCNSSNNNNNTYNTHKTVAAPKRNDRTVSSSCFPGADNDDECTVKPPFRAAAPLPPPHQQPDSSTLRHNCPRVIISYQRRGKATHDAFRRGLHELFSHVEVLNPPNFDKPEVFNLLLCQR